VPTTPALAELHQRVKRSAPGYMLLLAVVIGLLGGYGAVGFRWLIEELKTLFWATDNVEISWIESLPWYWVVFVPALGGLAVGAITRWFAPEAKGHGVPEVMEAVAKRGGIIRPRVVVAKAVASGLSIASGGSVGREGPIVQIGSAIGSTVGQILRVGPRRMRTLVGCGAAAAVAATFNAPVAGALFAVEVILGDFGVPQFSPIVIASVAATVVSHRYLGNLPAFEIPTYEMNTPWELVAYTVLGILAGVLAWVFVRTLCWHEDRFDALRWPMPIKAAVGGAVVGALALLEPGVLGVGYESMNSALMDTPGMYALAILLVAKLIAVCVTLGSGGSGGVFAPSLFLGATLGGLVGLAVNAIAPGLPAPPGAYALVGMGAMVAATTHAPITAILIIFEMTNDYRIMLPLMTACILALMVSSRLDKESIYTTKLIRRGVNVRAGQDINLLRGISVREVVVRDDLDLVGPGERLSGLITRLSESDAACFYMVDEGQRLLGLVSMKEVRSALGDADLLADLVVASDIADQAFPSVSVDDSLDTVLTRLDLGYRDELPVLEGERLIGIVRISDVLIRYRVELDKRELERTA
jgi:CIC family chloride channel protein